jgi:hypothetical protein
LAVFKKIWGEEHANVATLVNNLGMALAAVGEREGGKKYLQRAYEIFLKFYGEAHPHTQTALENLQAVK